MCINTEVKEKGQKLETVTRLNYLVSFVTDEGSKLEILSRMAQTTAALTRLKPVWTDRNTSLSSKIRLMRSLVTSIFLYACESWTLTAELQRRKRAMEMRCYRKILRISYKDHYFYQCQDPVGNRTTQGPDRRKATQTEVVWTCPPFNRYGQNRLARRSERGKKTRQTEKEVGRQHQVWSSPGPRGRTGENGENKL